MFKVNSRKTRYKLVGGCAVVGEVSVGAGLVIVNPKKARGIQFDPSPQSLQKEKEKFENMDA